MTDSKDFLHGLNRITRVKYSKVLIIGSGIWGNKLNLIVQRVFPEFEVKVFSARKFIESMESFTQEILGSDLIWIASNPSIQLRILEKLLHFESKIVLEKPAFTTKTEFLILKNYLEHKSNVFISEAWTYSNAWMITRKTLQLNFPKQIFIRRGSNLKRSSMPSWLDWCFHDLLLIFSLGESAIQNNSIQIENELARIQFKYQDIDFYFECGFMNQNEAIWKFEDYVIDFNRHLVTSNGEIEVFQEADPVASQLEAILNSNQKSNIFEKIDFLNSVLEESFLN